jgi:hypothetical protein
MIELTVGKNYSTQELANALGISRQAFTKRKDEYLDSLSKAYEYKIVYKGRTILYTITKQINDFQKPERKNSKEKTEAIIHQFIRDTIEKDNLQTAANIGRCAFKYQEGKKTSVEKLGLKQSTVQEYARVQMKEMFGNKINQDGTDGYMMEKVWCRLDRKNVCYEEMEKEAIDDYLKIISNIKKDVKKEDTEAYEDYKNGLITKEEYKEFLCNFNCSLFTSAKRTFYEKYGFYPIKVPRYQLCAWQNAAT